MRSRPKWLAVPLAGSFLAAMPAMAEWVDWTAEADVTYSYDSNLSNSAFDSEELDDSTWRPTARVGRVFQFAPNTRLRAMADVRGDVHHRWSNLDSISGSAQLSLFHKFGLGDAPWGRIFCSGGYEGVQDKERSGSRFDVGAELGKRFSPRFDASLGYRFAARNGDDGLAVVAGADTDVWDQQHHGVFIEARFLITDRLLAAAGYEFRHGDLYSNARARRTVVAGMADVKAVARDRVFGGWAYRLNGDAHAPFLSLNYGIGDHWSIDASYRFRYAESDSLDYESHVAGLTVLFRY